MVQIISPHTVSVGFNKDKEAILSLFSRLYKLELSSIFLFADSKVRQSTYNNLNI